ncbi:MAG: hypothetical protein ABH851_03930 [Methanobacteriota archaeon]
MTTKIVRDGGIGQPETHTISATLPVDPKNFMDSKKPFDRLNDEVGEVLTEFGFAGKAKNRTLLCCEEVASNIVQFALPCDACVTAEVTAEQAAVSFTWHQQRDVDFVTLAKERERGLCELTAPGDGMAAAEFRDTEEGERYANALSQRIEDEEKGGRQGGGAGMGVLLMTTMPDRFESSYDADTHEVNVSFTVKNRED